MRALVLSLLVLFSLAACEEQRPVYGPPILLVPTASLIGHPRASEQVLVGPDAEAFAWRPEKAVEGNMPIAGLAAFTTYTYDAQNISLPNGVGYRYRWVWQSGVSSPPVP